MNHWCWRHYTTCGLEGSGIHTEHTNLCYMQQHKWLKRKWRSAKQRRILVIRKPCGTRKIRLFYVMLNILSLIVGVHSDWTIRRPLPCLSASILLLLRYHQSHSCHILDCAKEYHSACCPVTQKREWYALLLTKEMKPNSEKTKNHVYNEHDDEVVKIDGFINFLWMHHSR
jgi:hypothetical protein